MRRILIALSLLFTFTASHASNVEIQHVFGWIENATLEPWGVKVKSKLDTGALTSSLHRTKTKKCRANLSARSIAM